MTSSDDAYIKAMIVLSILIICLGILTIIMIYIAIRAYQDTRNDILDDASQMDQIDYLIGLLDEQESILLSTGVFSAKEMRPTTACRYYVEHELDRLIALHKEFSDQLTEMMAGSLGIGLFQKAEDELMKRGKNKINC